MKVEWIPLRELMLRAGSAAAVDPSRLYPTLGVKSHARGAFDSGVLQGDLTAYKTLTRVQVGWLVYPKLMAWEGALALVPDGLDGRWVTPEFITYDVKDDALSAEYLRHLIAWPGFLNWVRNGSTGTNVRRRRLQPAAFEAIRVPLPARPDQDRIAAHLGALSTPTSSARVDHLVGITQRDWAGEELVVSDVLEPVARREQPTADTVYPMQGVKWYGEGLFTRELRAGSELPGAVFRIEPGDLVYNRLFAWKQSFALATAVGWASNEFPTFRVRTDGVRPRVLLACLLSPKFTAAVNAASTGSTPTSRNRLKERDFLALPITIPRPREQAAIEASLQVIDRIKPLARRAEVLAGAVLPAARNEIFSAMR